MFGRPVHRGYDMTRSTVLSIPHMEPRMKKVCIFAGMIILGWVGWWVGSGFGVMTAYLLSGVGSLLGVYLGWRINRDFFS